MAAKLLHSLTDDNPDLQKQIGCMTGIFQIFDRHHILSGRRFSGHNPRRLLTPGNSQYSNGSLDGDSISIYSRETMERSSIKYVNEKRISTESSRASFSSSSRSSSFSSLDCGRTGQPEPSSLDRIIFPETPSSPVITQPSASPKFGRHSVDLRDVVKGSMYRESRGLSVHTAVEGACYPLKHRDSPRPLQLSKSVDGSLGVTKNGKHGLPADLKESLRVLAKLREAPWYYIENKAPNLLPDLKDGRIRRDAPRFSYDGREMNHSSFESRDTFQSAQKIKDLPRLSLDSRESTAQGSRYDSKSMRLCKYVQIGNDEYDERVSSLQQASAVQTRPASVVAKLMGLEALPDVATSSTNHLSPVKTLSLEDSFHSSSSLKTSDACRPIRRPNSPSSMRREPSSPQGKDPSAVMKPVSSSKFPIEPAPWKHHDGSRVSPKQASKHIKSPSVYCEIEKRLKDLEFKQSGKDLRALKQILEAMQAKGLLDTTDEEQTSNKGSKRVDERRYQALDVPALINPQDPCRNRASAPRLRGSGPLKTAESPIVIMKPAKLVQRAGIPAASLIPVDGLSGLHRYNTSDVAALGNPSMGRRIVRDQTPKDSHRDCAAPSTDKEASSRNLRVAQTSTRPQSLARDNTTSSIKNSGSTSPRLQQKKLELDRKSRPPTPPSDSNKPRRQSNWQSSESSSPGGRRRPKSSNLQQNDGQLSNISNESRNLNCQGDDVSMQSDTHLTMDSKIDTELTSAETAMEVGGYQSPSTEAFKQSISGEMQNASLREEDDPVDECASITPECLIPSPISVLDASAYTEDPLSPVKQASRSLQDCEILNSDEIHGQGQWDSVDDLSANCGGSVNTSEMSRQKLQNIENLVVKLRQLNSTHDEARTDYIASLCENPNPEHRYVSEILLASGLLLRDLSSGLTAFQLHPSGHPINPELFFVLEQTKASSCLLRADEAAHSKHNPEKLNRKLIFDAVNEILAIKLVSLAPPSDPWLRPDRLTQKTIGAQKLLKQLCAEIEQLQPKKSECSILEDEDDGLKRMLWEDVMQRSDNWTDFRTEISSVVLDVERLIFKDLVDEIVIGEAAAMKGKRNRHCRQLF